jgi:hypothetical protein
VLIGNNGYSDMAGVVHNNIIDANHTVGGAGNGIAGGKRRRRERGRRTWH